MTDELNSALKKFREAKGKDRKLASTLDNLLEAARHGVTMIAENRLVTSPFMNPDFIDLYLKN